jgi:hypothetical protein
LAILCDQPSFAVILVNHLLFLLCYISCVFHSAPSLWFIAWFEWACVCSFINIFRYCIVANICGHMELIIPGDNLPLEF